MTLRLRVERYRHKVCGSAKSPRLVLDERRGSVLTLEPEPELFGQGEAAPLPGYSDESLHDAERVLGALDPVKVTRLAELVDTSEWDQALDRELELSAPRCIPSARYALESALFDLTARRRGLPLHALLRDRLGVSRGPIVPVERAALLALDPGLHEAEAALAAGYKTLKFKVGARAGFAEEHARLARLRARAGLHFKLRLDANQGFHDETALANLNRLAELGVELIEEPTPAGAPWLELPPIGVALDESLRSAPSLNENAVRRHGLVALVLKPSVLGGLLHCLRLAHDAHELGLAAIVSHTFEGPVGFAVLLEFALALGPARFASGLGPHAGLFAWPEAVEMAHALPHWAPHRALGTGLPRVLIGPEMLGC